MKQSLLVSEGKHFAHRTVSGKDKLPARNLAEWPALDADSLLSRLVKQWYIKNMVY